MPSKKTTYSIQVVVILAIFFFVLFNLVFKLIIDLRSESLKKKAEQIEKDRIKQEFIAHIDDRYAQLLKLYAAKEYEKVIEIIKVFNKYEKSDYKNLPEIKKEIRLFYLKKKLDFIPKIHLDDYMKLSKDIDIVEDDSTEVFIRTPRYGQYFYTSDFPILLEGVALSIAGDFSDGIVWTSNIDGVLGKGGKIEVRLSIGEHQITATGTNGVTTGTMKTRIYIEKDPDFLKKYIKK
ncbi:MAG: hypothetical protein KKE44_00910 [Proteobacteria bacterium]|nr:hypothetical protein [Pseudomonadota bacterium]MBU1581286.1 hypothetical protein [Pseudomonadota bacterium]MBU2452773.1 hypothetical protein [Pseudomonadota bacterium]MBU2627040.1 hypothetical protein [Pseudomonadota bacterium]